LALELHHLFQAEFAALQDHLNWLMSYCDLIYAELRLVSFNNARCRNLLKLIYVRGIVVSRRTLVEFIYILLLRFRF